LTKILGKKKKNLHRGKKGKLLKKEERPRKGKRSKTMRRRKEAGNFAALRSKPGEEAG